MFNVAVLLLDTLRYDYAMDVVDFRDTANRGWVFERMYGGSTFTYPNLCSLRSGLYPIHHGWRTFPNNDPFRADVTFCDILKEAGYHISTTMETPPEEITMKVERPHREPFFRFCWFTGIHDCVYSWTCHGVPKDHYADCIQTCTEWLDRALKLFSDSLILVFGDHGVGLEGDVLRDEGHDVGAGQIYDFRIHVPCVLAGPMLEHRVIKEAYSLADLMPTMLDILGLPIPEGLDGYVVGQREEPVFLEAQSPYSIWPSPVPNVFGAVSVDGTMKVMSTPEGWRCYDLAADPKEQIDRQDLLDSEEGQQLVEFVKRRMDE